MLALPCGARTENARELSIAESGVGYGVSVRSGVFTMGEAAWRISSMGGGVQVQSRWSRVDKSYETRVGAKRQGTTERVARVCPCRQVWRGQGPMGNMAQRCGQASYETQGRYHGKIWRRAGMATQG
jgi:transposase